MRSSGKGRTNGRAPAASWKRRGLDRLRPQPSQPSLSKRPKRWQLAPRETQAGPDPALATAASLAMTGEGATAEASSGEDNEQGPAVAGAPSVAANDPVPEQIPTHRWQQQLFRAMALGR